jgi:Zn ribbon nucleic-acid-binding protein
MEQDNGKIECPVCKQIECYVEAESGIDSYLCVGCGYTTTSKHVHNSIDLRQWEQVTAEIIKASKFVDTNTNLVWYPSVLNFPSKGLIFPDGTNESNWKWRMAPVVQIPEEERTKYPVPGKKDEYYSSRINMGGSKLFERNEFKTACEELGILQKAI